MPFTYKRDQIHFAAIRFHYSLLIRLRRLVLCGGTPSTWEQLMQTFHTHIHLHRLLASAYSLWPSSCGSGCQRIARGDDVRCEYAHAKRLILISVLIISDFLCSHFRVRARAHQPNISCEYKTVMTITITMLRAHRPHWTPNTELSVLCSGRAPNSYWSW